MTTETTPWRWDPLWLRECVQSNRIRFIAQCGEYDLWDDLRLGTYTVVDHKGLATDYEMTNGVLDVSEKDADKGVRPDPYHMCLIYQAIETRNNPT